MKTRAYLGIVFILVGLVSCNTIKTSRYSAYNEFSYAKEQPVFHFQNDTLKVEGAWHWGTRARAIPKVSYLPKVPFRVLRPITKEHGPVLFTTWLSERKKYFKKGFVPVSKRDVRYEYKVTNPIYIAVLRNNHQFNGDTNKYKPKGRNNDYQFQLYATRPQPVKSKFWTMKVVAAAAKEYYTFVCILDQYYLPNKERQQYEAALFLEDIQTLFVTQ